MYTTTVRQWEEGMPAAADIRPPVLLVLYNLGAVVLAAPPLGVFPGDVGRAMYGITRI